MGAVQTLGPIASPKVPGEDATHIIFILDRSGSMQGKEADVIGGVNAYIADLRETPSAVGVSYVRFDEQV